MTKNNYIPKDGLAGFKENWKGDIISGFLVFLIALPLCLGIAMASGFPPIGGILTAIIGGLIVGPIMGSKITIKGPAAGLIAIAVVAVADLGGGNAFAGYRYALAIVVAAGLIQVLFGYFKLGRYVDFFPASAVHGMLAAIGIIIIAKQFPTMLGVKPESSKPLSLLMEIPSTFAKINPEIALIGVLSLLILFGLPMVKNKWVRMIPAPMLVLLVAFPLSYYFDLSHEHKYLFNHHLFVVGERFLVTLPHNITDGITFPDFGKLFTLTSLKYIVMFALVGSLESLLTVKAIDGLDPYHRKSNANRDILAVGTGNVVAGLIGGLPMISEVVRSSANVNNGAKTRWANIFHGGFLLIFVAFFPGLIHQIPLAALAAMLVYTGYRLASPELFRHTYHLGKEQIAIFLVTIFVTLAEDLLLGIAAGVVVEMMYYNWCGVPLRYMFKAKIEREEFDNTIVIKIKEAAVFSNSLEIIRHLEDVTYGKDVIIDFEGAKMIDHTMMKEIHRFEKEHQRHGSNIRVIGHEDLKSLSKHHLAGRRPEKSKKKAVNKRSNPKTEI